MDSWRRACLSSEPLEKWAVRQQGELLESKGWCVELQEEIGVGPCWELHVELEGIWPFVCSLLYALIFIFLNSDPLKLMIYTLYLDQHNILLCAL